MYQLKVGHIPSLPDIYTNWDHALGWGECKLFLTPDEVTALSPYFELQQDNVDGRLYQYVRIENGKRYLVFISPEDLYDWLNAAITIFDKQDDNAILDLSSQVLQEIGIQWV